MNAIATETPAFYYGLLRDLSDIQSPIPHVATQLQSHVNLPQAHFVSATIGHSLAQSKDAN